MFFVSALTRTLPALASVLVLIAATQTASASELFFTNEAAYDAALTVDGLSSSSYNFNSTPAGNYDTAAGLTIDGVNFVGPTGNGGYRLSLTPANFCCNDYTNPNVSLQAPAVTSTYYNISDGSTDITLPTGTTAFSLTAYTVQAGDYSNSGQDTLNLDVDGTTGQTVTLPGSETGFIGVISTVPLTSAVLTGSTNEDFIDIIGGSVSNGTVVTTATPEPSTWGLMFVVGGILLSRGWRHRRQLKTGTAA